MKRSNVDEKGIAGNMSSEVMVVIYSWAYAVTGRSWYRSSLITSRETDIGRNHEIVSLG